MTWKGLIRDASAFGGLPLYLVVMIVYLFLPGYTILLRLLAGLGIAYFATALIRAVYFKERPDHQIHNTYLQKLDASAFPSLHTMRATVLGIILMNEFANAPIVIFLALGVVITGISRILLKRHDWADVIAGFVLGVGIGVGMLFLF